MLRRHPHLLLEECAKIRSIGEAEFIGNLLNIFLRILQQRDTLTDNRLEYKFLHRIPTDAFGKSRKVFRRQTEFIRVKFHSPFLHIMFLNQLNQTVKKGFTLKARGVFATIYNGD